ncbi:unnamed protein product [Acanthoscelides obtectus]|uniref:Uncharacterized protein n=1 Tax=Acanthoscelides obtectus TaxID=200917 RepID=A0A9P0KHI6_ACAOB|nr:unnamed protein product [Acanthoscelides obtectus]CAK1667441.1 hypothetical protein AOBTE_LOCUS25847 [Acanthoscelides obtectus]
MVIVHDFNRKQYSVAGDCRKKSKKLKISFYRLKETFFNQYKNEQKERMKESLTVQCPTTDVKDLVSNFTLIFHRDVKDLVSNFTLIFHRVSPGEIDHILENIL